MEEQVCECGYAMRLTVENGVEAYVCDVGHPPVYRYTDVTQLAHDPVNHPPHYTDRVPGIEAIDVTEHFSFLRGNAIKYLWRAGLKGSEIEDLKKARWYINREIANLEGADE